MTQNMIVSIKIKLHSEVDVITNSSTTIYTRVSSGGIDTVKDIVNTLLKIGNSELTADDLFTFEITSDEFDEQRLDLLYDRGILEEYVGRDISYNDVDFDTLLNELFNKIKTGEYPEPDWWDYGYGHSGETPECASEITVTCKSDNEHAKKAAELLSSLSGLFYSEEKYG